MVLDDCFGRFDFLYSHVCFCSDLVFLLKSYINVILRECCLINDE